MNSEENDPIANILVIGMFLIAVTATVILSQLNRPSRPNEFSGILERI